MQETSVLVAKEISATDEVTHLMAMAKAANDSLKANDRAKALDAATPDTIKIAEAGPRVNGVAEAKPHRPSNFELYLEIGRVRLVHNASSFIVLHDRLEGRPTMRFSHAIAYRPMISRCDLDHVAMGLRMSLR